MMTNLNLLPLSALQHYSYCPRQFSLIHVEQAWEENRYTAEGRLVHERVDAGENEQRGKLRYERGVQVRSDNLQLIGKLDLLEIETGVTPLYFPVEYKRGTVKVENWDRIQLCAQALCIEEMRNVEIAHGALWYWQSRHRESVPIDLELRSITLEVIRQAHALMNNGITPGPTSEKSRCRACSLVDVCLPNTLRRDRSTAYIEKIGGAA